MWHRKKRHFGKSNPLNLEMLERRDLFSLTVFDPIWRYGGGGQDDAFVIEQAAVERPLNVLDNDWRYDGSAESIESVTQPEHGTVSIDGSNGQLLLTMDADYVGTDFFEYEALDSKGNTYSAIVRLNVVVPLVAMPDWVRVDESSSGNTINVLDNDYLLSAVNGLNAPEHNKLDQLTITQVSTSTPGVSVMIADDGRSLLYSAADNFAGADQLTYTVTDERGNSSTATVTVQVTTVDVVDADHFRWQEELDHFLLDLFVESHASKFGTGRNPFWRDWYYDDPLIFTSMGIPQTVSLRSLSVTTDAAFSFAVTETNAQIAGVDEADLVKTDGRYMYIVSNRQLESESVHELIVIDLQDPTDPQLINKIHFDQPIREIFVKDNRVVVLSTSIMSAFTPDWGYTWETPHPTSFTATVLDMTDPTNPSIAQEVEIDGNLEQSRSIGNHVYLVSRFAANYLGGTLQEHCDDLDGASFCFFESAAQFVERFEQDGLTGEIVPEARSKQADGTVVERPLLTIEEISKSTFEQTFLGQQSVIVSTLDVTADFGDLVDVEMTAGGYSTEVYVSRESIYLLSPSTDGTEIVKYSISAEGDDVQYAATGKVAGSVLNRYSVDEYEGRLRMATTGHGWSSQVNVYVLEQQDDQLEVVGLVEDLAPNERIYATRFMGETGFVVTYRKVDPFFVMDLSDPTDPQVLGELKVPGYSQYLQILDENHVLGIGRNAQESSGLFQGLQVSIFDVSDPTAPTLSDRYDFEGGRNTWSPLAPDAWNLGDPHALTYVADEGVLALPIYSTFHWHGNYGGVDNTPIFSDHNQSAVRVLSIDVDEGIDVLGQVDFEGRANRSVRVGDYLYSMSAETLKVTELQDPASQLAELILGNSDAEPVDASSLRLSSALPTSVGDRPFAATGIGAEGAQDGKENNRLSRRRGAVISRRDPLLAPVFRRTPRAALRVMPTTTDRAFACFPDESDHQSDSIPDWFATRYLDRWDSDAASEPGTAWQG